MLNNNQLIAVQLAAQGQTGKFISEYLNVAEETISCWRKQPEFIASVNVILNQLRNSIKQRMKNILFKSLEILKKELTKWNSTVNVNLAFKIIQKYKIKNLIYEKIVSKHESNIKNKCLKKKLMI